MIYPEIEDFFRSDDALTGRTKVVPYSEVSQAGDRKDLLEDLKTQSEIDHDYCLMLYNDETHTFDQVENMLKQSVQATSAQVTNVFECII